MKHNKNIKRRVRETTMMDVIKAMKRGGREAEQKLLGPGFHATTRIHKSKKAYSRKAKHKKSGENDI